MGPTTRVTAARPAILAGILPPGTAAEEAFEDDPAGGTLFPEEEARLAKAVDKRRREFTTVRACARRALGRLGFPPAPILPGPEGEPRWPAGVVGSMTHCAGYRGVAVALSSRLATLGIDAEPHAPLPDGVLRMVAGPVEMAGLARLAADRPDVSWDRLLFCAKEAVYKAWYPLAERWLGFDDAEVTLGPVPSTGQGQGQGTSGRAAAGGRDAGTSAGTFEARLLVPGPTVGGRELTSFSGRWRVGDGLALTAIALPAPTPG